MPSGVIRRREQTKRCVLLGAGRRVKAGNAVKNRY
jgi:hypothetical protein